jgi:hypothetical protein
MSRGFFNAVIASPVFDPEGSDPKGAQPKGGAIPLLKDGAIKRDSHVEPIAIGSPRNDYLKYTEG